MTDCDIEQLNAEAAPLSGGFPPCVNSKPPTLAVRSSIYDRPCSDSELLECLLQTEFSRQGLARLVDASAKATREAEFATRQKSDFLATMSHEIRTPLNGIIGMTAVLLARSLEPAVRDCVETIRSSGEALLAIVDDILDFSKIEAGCLEIECHEFDLHALIREAIQIVQPAAARKPISLRTSIDPALPQFVRGDVVRLRQILLNLLSNAVKFTAAGNVELKAELASCAPDACEVRFSVSDEGIGMTPEQQSKLFRPFTQAEPSTTRKFGGTGLGLAICKRLVEFMGGHIGVESMRGQGSTFWFTIKAVAGSRSARAPSRTSVASTCSSKASTKAARLLLVEDNTINQKVALAMLKNLGYQADVARNGVEAVTAATCRHYDLVLMDCLMPEMDGFEATRRLRAQGGHCAQLPIVAMTASAFTEDRDACLAAGMTDYLSKPVRESELAGKIDRWLSCAGSA